MTIRSNRNLPAGQAPISILIRKLRNAEIRQQNLLLLYLIVGVAIGLFIGHFLWHSDTVVFSPAKPVATISPCTANGLTLRYADTSTTAAGTTGQLTFTNRGHASCQLTGYPELSLSGPDGIVGQAAQRTKNTMAKSVTLAAGRAAQATVTFTVGSGDSYLPCADGAKQLVVYLPSGGFLSVPTGHSSWCPGFSVGPFKTT